MEITLEHALKMRENCRENAIFKLNIYKHFDQSDRAKEVMESSLDCYSYWLRKVEELKNG